VKAAAVLFIVAAVAGLLAPNPRSGKPLRMGEYHVLAGDFHLHMFPLDETTLAPWDVVVEARRRGLDVIALTGHNQVWTAKVGRWFARRTGGPLVLAGEEIVTPSYHMIAVGIEQRVDGRGTAAESIAEIHRQGGVAIAAHPLRDFWPAYNRAAMLGLDGAEVLHPIAFAGPEYAAELREFYQRRALTAIGSSDFHGTSYPGFSRTYVFVHEVTEQTVLDALRERRTVAVDRDGRSYGDLELIRLAESNGGLPRSGVVPEAGGWSGLSRVAALAGMLAALLWGFTRNKIGCPTVSQGTFWTM
jgi:predicted metal-dependent phosphoesterase TrpH